MTGDPFILAANDYLSRQPFILAFDTITELDARFRRQARHFKYLFDKGKVTTCNPYHFTYEDIKEFYAYLREIGLRSSGIKHEITALNTLCKFCGNNCVEICKSQYPQVAAKQKDGYLPSFTDEQIELILNKASIYSIHQYIQLRAYAMVILSLCGGLRRKEVKFAKVDNLDLADQTLILDRVKGENTYGSARVVALRPSAIPILEKYLSAIEFNEFHPSEYLFFNIKTGDPLSDSSIDQIRARVSEDIGFQVTFQECRRSYGQGAVDDGLDLDFLSALMGHSSLVTTQKFYARTKPIRALKEAKRIFNEKEQEKQSCVH